MSDVVRGAIARELAQLEQVVRTPAEPLRYGVDLVCRDDLTPRLDMLSSDSVEGIGQALYHRLTTRRASLPDDADYGLDVRRYLSLPMNNATLRRIAGEIASECEKDDRVASASVMVVAPSRNKLQITIAIEPVDPELQTFELVLAVVDGVTLLETINGRQ